MTGEVEPLGPAWDRPLKGLELRGIRNSIPNGIPAGCEPVRLGEFATLLPFSEAGRSLAASPTLGCSCAIGAFDGVHAGHRELVGAMREDARERGLASVAVTFSPDPSRVVGAGAAQDELLSVDDRISALASLGVDAVLVIDFTSELATMSYERFVSEVLVAAVSPRSVHVGANFRMGAKGAGTAEAIAAYAAGIGIEVRAHDLVWRDGATVSATRIRSLVREGDVREAAALLCRPHFVRGLVEHGRGEGAGFGFPTANVRVGEHACLPAEGVYAALVSREGRAWPAAVNVGAPRTFGGQAGESFIEATLLGFEGDLYGCELGVSFIEWLREPRRFSSVEELERVVLGNVEWVRKFVGEGEVA